MSVSSSGVVEFFLILYDFLFSFINGSERSIELSSYDHGDLFVYSLCSSVSFCFTYFGAVLFGGIHIWDCCVRTAAWFSEQRGKKGSRLVYGGTFHWPSTLTQGTPRAKSSKAAMPPWFDFKTQLPLPSWHLQCFHRGQPFCSPQFKCSPSLERKQ